MNHVHLVKKKIISFPTFFAFKNLSQTLKTQNAFVSESWTGFGRKKLHAPDAMNDYVPPLYMPLSTNFFKQYILASTLNWLNHKVLKKKIKIWAFL